MFMLYALPVGLLAGWLTGGSLRQLSEIRLRWAWLALAGLLIQVVLFFGPVADRVGWLGMPVYVGSTALVLVAVLRNLSLPGLLLVALGAVSNLAAIVANGGYMPASPEALAALGRSVNSGYSNSAVVESPTLAPLTDIFAIPPGIPFSNVFSIGDVLIGVGVAWAMAAAMHRRTTSPWLALLAARLAPRRGRATPLSAATSAEAPALGRLEPVRLDAVWADARAFAAWLAANLGLVPSSASPTLSSAQVMDSDPPVVLAERSGNAVVIACELGPTTDEGFGTLVRHVAACGAEEAYWICSDPRDEHVATVSWMNQAFGARLSLLRLDLVRIGRSSPAPRLEVVVRPVHARPARTADTSAESDGPRRHRLITDWLAAPR